MEKMLWQAVNTGVTWATKNLLRFNEMEQVLHEVRTRYDANDDDDDDADDDDDDDDDDYDDAADGDDDDDYDDDDDDDDHARAAPRPRKK